MGFHPRRTWAAALHEGESLETMLGGTGTACDVSRSTGSARKSLAGAGAPEPLALGRGPSTNISEHPKREAGAVAARAHGGVITRG